jgi:hypothetical protein
MARFFDGATGLITTGLTTHSTLRSWGMWVRRDGDTEAGFGRMWDKGASEASVGELLQDRTTQAVTRFQRRFSTTDGFWHFTRTSVGAWTYILVTYDAGSASNDPVIYVDGSSVSVTVFQAPVGSVVTNAEPYRVGNTSTDTRTWNGALAEFVIYDRILTADQGVILYVAGPRALPFASSGYWSLFGDQSPEPDWSGNNNHATVAGTSRVDHPLRQAIWTSPRYRSGVVAPLVEAPTLRTVQAVAGWR